MMNLLRLEFRRLFRAKSFYICLAISLVMIVISAATTKMLLNMASSEEFGEAFGAMLQTPTSFSLLKSTASSSLTMVLAIFLSIFVCEDYTSDTIKNIYAKGHSRDQIFASKLVSAVAAGLIIILVSALFSFAAGKVLFGKVGSMGKNYVGSVLAELVILLAYATLYFAIAIALKKTGASIAVSILGPLLVGLLLSLANAAIKSDKISLTDYWLDGRLTILTQPDVPGKDVLIGFVVGVVVLLIAAAAGFLVNRSSEQ